MEEEQLFKITTPVILVLNLMIYDIRNLNDKKTLFNCRNWHQSQW